MCVTLSQEAYDRGLEIADNENDGNLSKTIEMLINNYFHQWMIGIGHELIDGEYVIKNNE
jgi:hypothetical protein